MEGGRHGTPTASTGSQRPSDQPLLPPQSSGSRGGGCRQAVLCKGGRRETRPQSDNQAKYMIRNPPYRISYRQIWRCTEPRVSKICDMSHVAVAQPSPCRPTLNATLVSAAGAARSAPRMGAPAPRTAAHSLRRAGLTGTTELLNSWCNPPVQKSATATRGTIRAAFPLQFCCALPIIDSKQSPWTA